MNVSPLSYKAFACLDLSEPLITNHGILMLVLGLAVRSKVQAETSVSIGGSLDFNYPHDTPSYSLSAGKMLTHMGLGYILFTYAIPLWHTGVALHSAWLGEKVSANLYLYNKTYGVYQNERSKTVSVQIKYSPTQETGYAYNFLSGPEIDLLHRKPPRPLNFFKIFETELWTLSVE